MKLYQRICQIVEQDRKGVFEHAQSVPRNLRHFSFLDQKGPRTLNSIRKKNVIKDIEQQNLMIKQKINEAKSNYSLQVLEKQTERQKQHRSILQSNSQLRLDPLVRKVNTSMASNSRQSKVSLPALGESA